MSNVFEFLQMYYGDQDFTALLWTVIPLIILGCYWVIADVRWPVKSLDALPLPRDFYIVICLTLWFFLLAFNMFISWRSL